MNAEVANSKQLTFLVSGCQQSWQPYEQLWAVNYTRVIMRHSIITILFPYLLGHDSTTNLLLDCIYTLLHFHCPKYTL